MNIKKIIKNIILIAISIVIIFNLFLYIIFNLTQRLRLGYDCKQYIKENYKNAEIIDARFKTQIAFIIPGAEYRAIVRIDDYEFKVEASNWLCGEAEIYDYYGSSSYTFLDDDLENKLKNFLINHELFEGYKDIANQLDFKSWDERDFVSKNKVDKNTLENLSITVSTDFNPKRTILVNGMESEQKHKLLNDIYDFLEGENIKVQELELNFEFIAKDEDNQTLATIRDSVLKYSDEFLEYVNNRESNEKRLKSDKKEEIIRIAKDGYLDKWEIEDVYEEEYESIVNIVLNNLDDKEIAKTNIKMFLQCLENNVFNDDKNTDIYLRLKDDNHKYNERHYIKYYRK